MTNWIRELGEHEFDETHVLLSRRDYDRMTPYVSIRQPTGPSVGRCFRTGDGCLECRRAVRPSDHPHLVVFVEPDPDPEYVRRVGRVPLFVD